jgi:hypothetical protein
MMEQDHSVHGRGELYTFVEYMAYEFWHKCKALCFQYIIRLYLIMKNTKLIRESYNV